MPDPFRATLIDDVLNRASPSFAERRVFPPVRQGEGKIA
jgi:hypothetical protein